MKKCGICQKEIKYTGRNCYNCARKIREEKRKGRPCSCCNRTNVLIYRQKDMLCVMCCVILCHENSYKHYAVVGR